MNQKPTPMQIWYKNNKDRQKANVKAYQKTDKFKAYKKAYYQRKKLESKPEGKGKV